MSFKHKIIIFLLVSAILFCFFVYGLYFCTPKIYLKEDNVTLQLGTSYQFNDFYAKQYFSDISGFVVIDKEVDFNRVGDYIATYRINKGLFKVEQKQNVKVVDTVEPVIQLSGDKIINICSLDSYQEPGYIAIDNYDGDITDKVDVSINNYFVYYSVLDSSSNEGTAGRILKIDDTEPPLIDVNGDTEVYVKLNDVYQEEGVIVTDNCSVGLNDKVIVSGNVDTSVTGIYPITYTVSDDNGNTSSIKRNVHVFDPSKNNGIIFLTFDDGPGSYTNQILDTLKKYNIKATFFVTMNGDREIIKREYDEGHTVGLHTATHQWSIYDSADNYFNDLNRVSERVKSITGYESKYIRFPGGSSNTVSRSHSKGIMTYLTEEVMNRGYKYYDWNVCVEDAGACAKKSVKDRESCVYNYFTKGISEDKANIVLLHDIKSYTASSLDKMIKYALDRGYKFKAIDDTTPQIHMRVNN